MQLSLYARSITCRRVEAVVATHLTYWMATDTRLKPSGDHANTLCWYLLDEGGAYSPSRDYLVTWEL